MKRDARTAPARIGCVLFDAAGTLIEIAEPVGVTYARIAERHGLHVAPGRIERAFREAFATAPPLAFPEAPATALPMLERAWWRDLVTRAFAACGVAPGIALECAFDAMFAHFAAPEAWRVFDDVPPALAEIASHGVVLAVLSNFDGRLPPLLEALGIRRYFSSVFVSSSCGAAKPSPAFFEHALVRVGADARETIHVGDSLALDIEGARAAGLFALRIAREEPSHACTLRSLGEIPNRFRGRLRALTPRSSVE